jgi:hypothetical protein
MPPHLGLIVFGICVVAAIALVAVGVSRIVAAGTVLKKHVESYRDLPLLADFETAGGSFSRLQRDIDEVAVLRARYERAVAEIATARVRILTMAGMVVRVFRRQYRL